MHRMCSCVTACYVTLGTCHSFKNIKEGLYPSSASQLHFLPMFMCLLFLVIAAKPQLALCPWSCSLTVVLAFWTIDLHSLSPGLGEHTPNSTQPTNHTISHIIIIPSPDSWAASEELVPYYACSPQSLYLQNKLWPPLRDTAPHEHLDDCGDHCAGTPV